MGRGEKTRAASVMGLVSENSFEAYDYAARALASPQPVLFTSDGRQVASSLKRAILPLSESALQKTALKASMKNGEAPNEVEGEEVQVEERKVNLPAIPRLLKPKDMDTKRRQRKKNQEGQEHHQRVAHDTLDLVDEAQHRLKREIKHLSTNAKQAGFILNTGKLWKQSGFNPPDKHSQAIKDRHRDFLRWKDESNLSLQQKSMASSVSSLSLPTSQGAEGGSKPASVTAAIAQGMVPVPPALLNTKEAETEALAISPREATEIQAAEMIKILVKTARRAEKEFNASKHERIDAEKKLADIKGGSFTTATKHMKSLQHEGARLEASAMDKKCDITEVEVATKARMQERKSYEHLKTRLQTLSAQDDKAVKSMELMLKKHELDLEALRAKFKEEMPMVEKTLLNNDLLEQKLVIESVRKHYSKELEERRQQVREAAALRLEMFDAEEREKKLEAELLHMYDPSVDSPRRNELKRKLVLYQDTLEMMMSKLGDVSLDRITAVFTQMKDSKKTWDDAVRDAEARCEELRREHAVLQQAAKRMYERESEPVGDESRRIHQLQAELAIKAQKGSEGEEKVTHLYQRLALVRTGLYSVMQRTAKVAAMPDFLPPNFDVQQQQLSYGASECLEDEVLQLLSAWRKQIAHVLGEMKSKCSDIEDPLPNFKGFAPISLVSTTSTSSRPMTITISAGKQEQVLGIAMSPTKHQGSESTTKEISLPLKPYTVASQASPDAADDRSADGMTHDASDVTGNGERVKTGTHEKGEPEDDEASGAAGTGDEGEAIGGKDEEEEKPKESGEETDDYQGYENETFDDIEPEDTGRPRGSPGTNLDRLLRPQPRAPPVDGIEDLGLFSEESLHQAVTSITFPHAVLQRRVKFPKGMRRKDKRKGITYCSDSDTQHSTGSETSFDYDEVERELVEEIYNERDVAKRRAAKAERDSKHTRKSAKEEAPS